MLVRGVSERDGPPVLSQPVYPGILSVRSVPRCLE